MNILLIIVLLVLLVSAWRGFKQGILGLAWGLISWIFILIFIMVAEPYIEDVLTNRTSIADTISTQVSSVMEDRVDEKVNNELKDMGVEVEEDTEDSENEIQLGFLDELGIDIPTDVLEAYTESLSNGSNAVKQAANSALEETKEEAAEELTSAATTMIMHGLAQIIAFMIAVLLCNIIRGVIRIIDHTPVIGTLGHFLGLVAGFCNGIIIIYLVFYVTSFLVTTSYGIWMSDQLEGNPYLLYMYEHNIVEQFISQFLS